MSEDARDEKMRSWLERCWKRWTMAGSVIAVLVGAFALSPSIADLRFWTTRHETALIAEQVYPTALKDHQLLMTRIQRRIEWLEGQGAKLKGEQVAELWDLRGDLIDAKEKETRLIKERAQFKMDREFR